jgi:hypothetical protein
MQFEKHGTGIGSISTGYRLQCSLSIQIDYKGAELQNTWRSVSYILGGEGFDKRNFS